MESVYVITGALTALILVVFFVAAGPKLKLIALMLVRYVNLPGLPVDPATGLTLLWFPHLLRRHWKLLLGSGLMVFIGLLSLAQATAILWSPEKLDGLRAAIYTINVVATTLAFYQLGLGRASMAVFRVFVPLLILSVLTVLLFRYAPDIERVYLQSALAKLFIGEEAAQLYQGRPNNVLLDERAGGLFFVNSNRASMFLGMHAMLFFAFAYISARPIIWRVIAYILLLGVFLTGSKTGLVLAVVLTVTVTIVLADRSKRITYLVFGTLIGAAVWLANFGRQTTDTSASSAYAESWEDRLPMWRAAYSFLRESPVAGLGFGGWQREWSEVYWLYGKPPSFPPHNLVIANYSEAGIVGGVATIGIGAIVLFWFARLSRAAGQVKSENKLQATQLWASAALVWAFIHALGDNTEFYGVGLTVGAYGCALSMLLARENISAPSKGEDTLVRADEYK